MATPEDPPTEGPASASRIRTFDLARGLAVVFMILVHVLRHWGDPSTWVTPIGTVISTLGGPPAAPVFMFLMGASLAFSRRTSFGSLARRGLWLIAAGYLLDFFRGTLPLSAGLATGVVTLDEVAPFTPFSLLTTVDILQLAGCSLILMAALRAVIVPGPAWLAVAAAVVFVAPFLHGHTTGVPVVDALLGMLWQTADTVYYPVFPWAVFPLVGAVIGEMLEMGEASIAAHDFLGEDAVRLGIDHLVVVGDGARPAFA
jgi:Predicted membrane protein